MSNCWKCGKELPDGQVECEYGCGDAPVDGARGFGLNCVFKPILNQADHGDRRTVSVCAWCLPGQRLLELFPWMKDNVELSHGICPGHLDDMLRSLQPAKGGGGVNIIPKGTLGTL